MKTAAKVFIVFGMIFGFYLIFPIVVGAIAFKKLNNATTIKEVHSFGIVTLFFCSFLGGIFMIATDETDLSCKTENSTVVSYETIEIPKDEQRALNSKNAGKSRGLMIAIMILSAICLILSLSTLALFGFDYYILYEQGIYCNLFQGSLQIIFAIIPLSIYLHNKEWVNKSCCIGLIICIPVYMICFLVSMLGLCMTEKIHFLFVLIMLIEFALLILCIITVALNSKVLHTKTKQKVVTSPLEIKLAEIKKLLENGTITQSEYDKMRERIISQFY